MRCSDGCRVGSVVGVTGVALVSRCGDGCIDYVPGKAVAAAVIEW